MMSIFGESKKLRGLIAPDRIECAPGFIGSIAVTTERWQQFAIKLHCPLKVFHSQINVIQNPCFHFCKITRTCRFAPSSRQERSEVRVVSGLRAESSTSIPTRSRPPRRLLCPRTRAATQSYESRPPSHPSKCPKIFSATKPKSFPY